VAERVHRAGRERGGGRHGREPLRVGGAVAVLMLPERGVLTEQALGGLRIVRSGLLGDVGAQRRDFADRDLVRGTSPLHDQELRTTDPGSGKRALRSYPWAT
jgi:hypothetical protein